MFMKRDLVGYCQDRKRICGHVIANEFDLTNHACFVFCFSAQTPYFIKEID